MGHRRLVARDDEPGVALAERPVQRESLLAGNPEGGVDPAIEHAVDDRLGDGRSAARVRIRAGRRLVRVHIARSTERVLKPSAARGPTRRSPAASHPNRYGAGREACSMADIAVQLYTLRSLDASLPELLDRVGDAGYDGVEFAYRAPESSVGDVLAALDRNDLAAASAHVPIEVLEDAPAKALEDGFDETVELYDRLRGDTLVVPWLDPANFESAAAVDALAARLDDLAEALDAEGLRLACHNHDQEFESVDGAPAVERLLTRTDDRVGLEIDVGWALVGGADPAALIDRHAERITHVHAADAHVARGEPVAFGEGDVDLDAVVASALSADAEWLVYAHDDPADPIASIERGAEALRDALE